MNSTTDERGWGEFYDYQVGCQGHDRLDGRFQRRDAKNAEFRMGFKACFFLCVYRVSALKGPPECKRIYLETGPEPAGF
jgi:hypothetical protein